MGGRLYHSRPDLIAGTAGAVLRAMDGHSYNGSVASLVDAIAAQVKAGKAVLTASAIKGLNDERILQVLRGCPIAPDGIAAATTQRKPANG